MYIDRLDSIIEYVRLVIGTLHAEQIERGCAVSRCSYVGSEWLLYKRIGDKANFLLKCK